MQVPKTMSLTPTEGQVQYSLQIIGNVLAGNVSFGHTTNNTDSDINIDCFKATGTTPGTADTEFSITHDLGRIPIGFLVASVNLAAIIYKSTTAWTSTHVYLKCNVATVAYFVILI